MAFLISYETKIKAKRGLGEGNSYKPWYQVGEKNTGHTFKGLKISRGNGHRIKGLKSKTIHHLLSDFEKLLFITFDLNPDISDIREQFPLLDIGLVRKISNELGIKYPNHSENHILTSDFLITYKDGHFRDVTNNNNGDNNCP